MKPRYHHDQMRKENLSDEIATYIRDEEEELKNEVQNRSKQLLALAIQKYASETTTKESQLSICQTMT